MKTLITAFILFFVTCTIGCRDLVMTRSDTEQLVNSLLGDAGTRQLDRSALGKQVTPTAIVLTRDAGTVTTAPVVSSTISNVTHSITNMAASLVVGTSTVVMRSENFQLSRLQVSIPLNQKSRSVTPNSTVPQRICTRGGTWEVKEGDSLSAIAKLCFGAYKHWPVIHLANRDSVPDPLRMPKGITLRIPATTELPSPPSAQPPQSERFELAFDDHGANAQPALVAARSVPSMSQEEIERALAELETTPTFVDRITEISDGLLWDLPDPNRRSAEDRLRCHLSNFLTCTGFKPADLCRQHLPLPRPNFDTTIALDLLRIARDLTLTEEPADREKRPIALAEQYLREARQRLKRVATTPPSVRASLP